MIQAILLLDCNILGENISQCSNSPILDYSQIAQPIGAAEGLNGDNFARVIFHSHSSIWCAIESRVYDYRKPRKPLEIRQRCGFNFVWLELSEPSKLTGAFLAKTAPTCSLVSPMSI
jgi:hypothetical protein